MPRAGKSPSDAFGPDLSGLNAELIFDSDEIQAVYLLRKKTPPVKPRLNDILRQIARIGGFLARERDGEPGVKTIWLRLMDVTWRLKRYARYVEWAH